MLDNFIRGGQIFLHNLAMFKQVMGKTFATAFILAIVLAGYLSYPSFRKVDFHASSSYIKAAATKWIHDNRIILHDDAYGTIPRINAHDNRGLYAKAVPVNSILKNPKFKNAYELMIAGLKSILVFTMLITGGIFGIIFLLWIRFGKSAKETKTLEGGSILTPRQITGYLRKNKKASFLEIDGMPLVKDEETRHILITGMTGSGKTNLINKILPQVRKVGQPAIVIDQTGEMIAKYYDPSRGDIIFNPLDARSKSWDFWTDCISEVNTLGINERLEKFAKILIGGNRKNQAYSSDPFWENSAEVIFTACVEYLISKGASSIAELKEAIGNWSMKDFKTNLEGTKAAKYFNAENSTTANSILSVMATSCRPLFYLSDSADNKFSLKEYFNEVTGKADITNTKSDAWLFLSAPPQSREVILPILSCILELAILELVSKGVNEQRRIWFVIDELASLGRLSSFNWVMTEGRKYGACVLAALQSYNQLLFNYGQYLGSTLFGQFATKFIFRCNEPNLASLMSQFFGTIEYRQQQKNTSYGAHEHRDGISYTEQERKKPVIEASKFMELNNLECFVSFPDPKIKVTQMQLVPPEEPKAKQESFVALPITEKSSAELLQQIRILDNKIENTKDDIALVPNAKPEEISSKIGVKNEDDGKRKSELESEDLTKIEYGFS